MKEPFSVALLPELVDVEAFPGRVAIVIDVLRASTTIVHALAAGAESVIPCASIEEARAVAAAQKPIGRTVLGGERDGRLIDGFDLDNSPEKYQQETVGGCRVAFTTTNGTRALLHAARADRILVAAFVNLDAIVQAVFEETRPVTVVCAGTNGQITGEDALVAGAIADRIDALTSRRQLENPSTDGVNPAARDASSIIEEVWSSRTRTSIEMNDQARMAMDFYRANSENHARLLAAMRTSHGGRNLVQAGFDRDIERAATIDRFSIVPEYNAATNEIRTESVIAR